MDQAITDYSKKCVEENDTSESEESLSLWTQLEKRVSLEMLTLADGKQAIKACNFSKGLGPYEFDSNVLIPAAP